MKRIVMVLSLIALFTSGCSTQADAPRTSIPEISVSDARVLHEKHSAIFLDVREPHEYAAGHIGGAINIPQGLLESRMSEMVPDKNAKIVVYCRTARRSASALQTLFRMGYKNAVNMKGGWQAYSSESQKI